MFKGLKGQFTQMKPVVAWNQGWIGAGLEISVSEISAYTPDTMKANGIWFVLLTALETV